MMKQRKGLTTHRAKENLKLCHDGAQHDNVFLHAVQFNMLSCHFQIIIFQTTSRMAKSLDPEQARRVVGTDLGLNVYCPASQERQWRHICLHHYQGLIIYRSLVD